MKIAHRRLILSGAMLLGAAPVAFTLPAQQPAAVYVEERDPLVRAKLERWQDLKLGLLMHWGTYSQWGIVESWSLCSEDEGWCRRKMDNYDEYKKAYEALQTTFNPVKFDPERWAKAAKDAGMKYVVFTTKHHDGFNMFDTQAVRLQDHVAEDAVLVEPEGRRDARHLRRVPRAGLHDRRVLLQAGLAQPRLLVAVLRDSRSQSQLRHQEVPRSLEALRRFHARADRRTDVELRARGHPLARRRMGAPALRRRDTRGDERARLQVHAPAEPGHRHAAARRGGEGEATGTDRRGSRRARPVPGLPHSRSARARQGTSLSMGSADADGAELVVRAGRPLQVAARADSHAGWTSWQRAATSSSTSAPAPTARGTMPHTTVLRRSAHG